MRVGLLTADLSHAHGWAHYSLSLLLALRDAGADVTVIAARNSPDVPGVTVHRLLPPLVPAGRGLLLAQMGAVGALRAALSGCDVVHAAVEPFAPAAAWSAAGRPLFVTAHGSYTGLLARRRWPAGALYRRALRQGTLICVSQHTAQMAAAALPGARTVVITNGIDPARFDYLPPLDAPKHGPTVLAVGAVKPRKGTLELVRALAVVRRTIPDAQGVIIGALDVEPGYTAQVRAEIAALGLTDSVHLLGHVPEATLLAWYGAADVFALPARDVGGRFEGFGLVYLEAGAAGLPVIGTTGCGAEDAIHDGVTGLLLPLAQVTDALPGAIIALLSDPARAARMGAAGRAWARTQTWARAAQQTLALYGSAAASPG
jgi:phosphatidylinositol alpha-1,6-mannosyltransferase